MLFAGTFTGFVEAFANTRGVVNLSNWSRKVSGCIISLAGAWFLWQAF
jgi:cytochrome c-type biogenesis protein